MKKNFLFNDMKTQKSHSFYKKVLVPIKLNKIAWNYNAYYIMPNYKKKSNLKDFKPSSEWHLY